MGKKKVKKILNVVDESRHLEIPNNIDEIKKVEFLKILRKLFKLMKNVLVKLKLLK